MSSTFRRRSVWVVVVCVIGGFLLGAWISAQIKASRTTEADWIEAIQSTDTN